jgi:hypothetical protein
MGRIEQASLQPEAQKWQQQQQRDHIGAIAAAMGLFATTCWQQTKQCPWLQNTWLQKT